MVVVSGDDNDGHAHLSDGVAGPGHGGLQRAGAVEQIAGDEDEGRLMLGGGGGGGDAIEAFEALILKPGAIGLVRHAGIGLAELPVGGVEEGE